MDMVSSAIYRYYPSRDDLLTALIVDAYNDLGATVEAADRGVADRADLRGRWLAAGTAVRDWALAKPAEYALLYGSPVPGYAAPQDTVAAAARTPAVLAQILADGAAAGVLPRAGATASAPLPAGVRADLMAVADVMTPGLPAEVLMTGLVSWMQLFGTVSFELFGQLNNVIEARAEFFEHDLSLMADVMGL